MSKSYKHFFVVRSFDFLNNDIMCISISNELIVRIDDDRKNNADIMFKYKFYQTTFKLAKLNTLKNIQRKLFFNDHSSICVVCRYQNELFRDVKFSIFNRFYNFRDVFIHHDLKMYLTIFFNLIFMKSIFICERWRWIKNK